MHQQIRLKLGAMGTTDGPGAMTAVPIEVDPIEVRKSLLDLLDALEAGGFDLLMAGGHDIDSSGEFVFAVQDERTTECVQYLQRKGFSRPRVIQPQHCHAKNEPGGLAACIRSLTLSGRKIHEIFIGVPDGDEIPVQITTVANTGWDYGTGQEATGQHEPGHHGSGHHGSGHHATAS